MTSTRAAEARYRLSAFWKLCLSFRKRDWSLDDYPVVVRRAEQTDSELPSRLKVIPYSAAIVNWWALRGSGDTEREALLDLEANFQRIKSERLATGIALPRPGTHVPIQFASTERVAAHEELADDFIRRVLELDWAFISDESSLWDFHGEEMNEALVQKIRAVYGVDVSDIESARLCDILDRIASSAGGSWRQDGSRQEPPA